MDLERFKQRSKSQKTENKRYFDKLRKLKPKQLDQRFHNLHEEVFAEVDCLECANCCKTTGPLFTNADIDRLANHLRLSPGEFIDRYLHVDEDGDFVLQQLPCPFLGADNYCSVYEARPKACREFPHTDRNKMHQILRLTQKNIEVCPAVLEMVERMKKAYSNH